MTRKEKIKFKKTVFVIAMFAILFISMIANTFVINLRDNPPETIEEFIKEPMRWIKAPMVWATEQDPGVGTAGIVQIVTVEDAFSSWDAAILTNIYEESDGSFTDASVDAPHEELDGTTPYETNCAIGVTYQFTKAMAYDNSAWNLSRVYAIINTTGFQDGDADTITMSEGAWYAGEDADTQRINFYILDIDGGAEDTTEFQVAIDSTWNANVTVYYWG